ncbi:MAG: P-loop NTPase [Candidatus Heteroscillospira sp.]|jgi:Mrp family chromosome partitioning ATPase
MSECNHDCSSCSSNCGERTAPQIEKAALHEGASVKKVIAVVSGKGGVGKSLVTALMAAKMQREGYSAAVLDADITGPSIPRVFGINERARGSGELIYPAESATGVQVMSLNLLLENTADPVVWRGPVIAGAVKQFYTDVLWDDVDFMFVDMPPGTGDVPLTVFQSLPLCGIIVVTSPQELVSMIVEKAVRMARLMNVPVLALVENMSYFQCPDCGGKHAIFGESHVEELAAKYGISRIAKLPIDPAIPARCDSGKVEQIDSPWLDGIAEDLVQLLK